jgi:hypothetical protein
MAPPTIASFANQIKIKSNPIFNMLQPNDTKTTLACLPSAIINKA